MRTDAAPVLPLSYPATRRSLHALACFVIAPACLARTGRIGLRPLPGGFGTPPFDDGSRIFVRDGQLVHEPHVTVALTTLRTAAHVLDVDLVSNPAVGRDLPPLEPDRLLAVQPESARVLAGWYAKGAVALGELRRQLAPSGEVTEPQLWPEHFDLAADVSISGQEVVTVGFSPGDAFCEEPYMYLSPRRPHVPGAFWNAPFGAYRRAAQITVPLDFALCALRHLCGAPTALHAEQPGRGEDRGAPVFR
jgi:hypothetical protein